MSILNLKWEGIKVTKMIDPEKEPRPIWDVVEELGKSIPMEEWEKFNEKMSGVDPEIKKVYEKYVDINRKGCVRELDGLGQYGGFVGLASDLWQAIRNHVDKNQNERKSWGCSLWGDSVKFNEKENGYIAYCCHEGLYGHGKTVKEAKESLTQAVRMIPERKE